MIKVIIMADGITTTETFLIFILNKLRTFDFTTNSTRYLGILS